LYEFNIGLVNTVLLRIGLKPVPWLSDGRFALLSITIVATWQFIGFPMIVILAGLENIPQYLHDAATLDGVNEVQRMFYITLPLIRQVMISITMLEFVLSMRVFDIVYVMTKGGPSNASEVLGSYLYKKGFQSYQFGFASAVAVLMFAVIFAIGYWYQRAIGARQVEY
jgi:ABC-type sugar transport system permease subunit